MTSLSHGEITLHWTADSNTTTSSDKEGASKSADSQDSHEEHGHEEHHDAGFNPMHHIEDRVFFGISKDGSFHAFPHDYHGHLREGHLDYEPKTVGPSFLPIKMELTQHMIVVLIAAIVVVLGGIATAKRVLKSLSEDKAPKGPLANAVEAILLYIRDEIVLPSGGHHIVQYTPLFITYFLFILTSNLMGMIPYFGTGTGNIGVTVALGGSILFLIFVKGIAHQGFFPFFKNLVPHGVPLPLIPLMFVLELVSPLIKCFVLCVRLFANMIAGHLVISNTLALATFGTKALLPWGIAILATVIGVPLALGISILEILVCFIQAYVFTMLAVMFVGSAVHPDH